MPDSAARPVSVHLLPRLIPPRSLAGGVAVVLDVLRASTAMIHALAHGCAAIAPCNEVDEALALAATFPEAEVILAGERRGVIIEGFALGNSPGTFRPEVCGGKTVVMTTTNGTRAILASLEADRVLVAAFANLGATIRALAADARPVHVVCAGTDGFISAEDAALAGVIALRLADLGLSPGNDEAFIAPGWAASRGLHRNDLPPGDRVSALSVGRGGRRVAELGQEADIAVAAEVDRFDLVAELHRDPLRIVASRADAAGPAPIGYDAHRGGPPEGPIL